MFYAEDEYSILMKRDSDIITKLFFGLLPVQILMVAIGSINAVIDGVMASNFISPDAMAITGLYMPVIKTIEAANAVLLGGSQILCGQFLGKNQIERTRGVFSLDILVIAALSLVLTGAGLLFPYRMAGALGADEEVREGLTQYILGISAGILPEMLGVQLTSFLQLEKQEKRTYVGIAAMMVANLLLNYLFIKILGLGMLGLGLATTISYMVFFVVLGLYYFSSKAVIKFIWQYIEVHDLVPIVTIGMPGALSTVCLAIRGILLNVLLLKTAGNDGISALSALNTFGYLLYAVTAGLAAATRLLVSVYIGEEDRESVIKVVRTALLKGVPIVCAVSVAVIALAGPLTYIFYKDTSSNVYYLTEWLFRIFPLCMPLSAICVIFVTYDQSSSRMKIVNILSASDGVLGIGAACIVLAPLYGAMGIWAAHVVNGIITTLIIIIYAWIVNGRMPRSIVDLMTRPEGFGVPDDRRLGIIIKTSEDVSDTSARVAVFCLDHGIDHRRAFYAALCMEEMAENIVEHGFDDGKEHYAEVCVVYKESGQKGYKQEKSRQKENELNNGERAKSEQEKDTQNEHVQELSEQKKGELLLRIKDDCRHFDPKEKLALIDPDDMTKNIGLRMVSKLAKTMSYTNMLGLNVLTITI